MQRELERPGDEPEPVLAVANPVDRRGRVRRGRDAFARLVGDPDLDRVRPGLEAGGQIVELDRVSAGGQRAERLRADLSAGRLVEPDRRLAAGPAALRSEQDASELE